MSNFQSGVPAAEIKMTGKVMAAMIILISSLMISGMLYHILRSGHSVEAFSSTFGIALLIALTVVPYATAYYLFKKFISPMTKVLASTTTASTYFRLTYHLLRVTLVLNGLIFVAIIVQMITLSQFSVALTMLSIQPTTILVTILSSYLGYKFVSWFRESRDAATLFLGLAFACIAFSSALSDVVNTIFFLLDNPGRMESMNMPVITGDERADALANLKSDERLHDLFLIIQLPQRIAFFLYWIATVMLLRKYSESIGKTRFWTLVSLPLVTFVIASIFIYGGFSSILLRGIISSAAALIAGILFGMIFLTIARRLRKTGNESPYPSQKVESQDTKGNTIYNYLMMSVFGTILFLVSNIPPNHVIDWVHIPYPPFADVVWSFIGFGIYLYSFGLFFSTVAISQDTRLRKSLNKLAMEEADLLRSLGTTRMKEELQKKVAKISKEQEEQLRDQTGIEHKVSDEEMKQYTDEVMKELQKIPRKK
jgi:hypothetical protein